MGSNHQLKKRFIGEEVEVQTEAGGDSSLRGPSPQEVRRRAFGIHVERGGIHGCDLNDWFEAEKELTEKLHRAFTGRAIAHRGAAHLLFWPCIRTIQRQERRTEC
jgi:hypothetical protein